MTNRSVLITPDPEHSEWFIASGRELLTHTHMIASVGRHRAGIVFRAEFADEVRAAISTAGFRIVDGQPRVEAGTPTPPHPPRGYTHRVYVADGD